LPFTLLIIFGRNALSAAEYGIFVDPKDTYDYTQHMRVMGENPDSVFIEAPSVKPKVVFLALLFLNY
jgi:protein LTV1